MSNNGQFIVVFKDKVSSEQISSYANELKEAGGTIRNRFDLDGGLLNGFSATIPDSYLKILDLLVGGVIAYIDAWK